jgi:hypothetical protein
MVMNQPTRTGWWRRLALVPVVLLLPVLGSCAALGPDPVTAGNPRSRSTKQSATGTTRAGACALLAPETLAEVEHTTGDSCDQTILTHDLPDANQRRTVRPSVAAPRSCWTGTCSS